MNWQCALIALCAVAVIGIGAAIYVGSRPKAPTCVDWKADAFTQSFDLNADPTVACEPAGAAK